MRVVPLRLELASRWIGRFQLEWTLKTRWRRRERRLRAQVATHNRMRRLCASQFFENEAALVQRAASSVKRREKALEIHGKVDTLVVQCLESASQGERTSGRRGRVHAVGRDCENREKLNQRNRTTRAELTLSALSTTADERLSLERRCCIRRACAWILSEIVVQRDRIASSTSGSAVPQPLVLGGASTASQGLVVYTPEVSKCKKMHRGSCISPRPTGRLLARALARPHFQKP
ncbi:hypothetical protein KC356_g327 [Hortaea werneckii]|nr:hypothetical protein KC356_g327 [Hortaea werneckii]